MSDVSNIIQWNIGGREDKAAEREELWQEVKQMHDAGDMLGFAIVMVDKNHVVKTAYAGGGFYHHIVSGMASMLNRMVTGRDVP